MMKKFLGEKCRIRRKILTPAFHRDNLQNYVDNIVENGEKIITDITKKGTFVDSDVTEFVTRYTLNVIRGKFQSCDDFYSSQIYRHLSFTNKMKKLDDWQVYQKKIIVKDKSHQLLMFLFRDSDGSTTERKTW